MTSPPGRTRKGGGCPALTRLRWTSAPFGRTTPQVSVRKRLRGPSSRMAVFSRSRVAGTGNPAWTSALTVCRARPVTAAASAPVPQTSPTTKHQVPDPPGTGRRSRRRRGRRPPPARRPRRCRARLRSGPRGAGGSPAAPGRPPAGARGPARCRSPAQPCGQSTRRPGGTRRAVGRRSAGRWSGPDLPSPRHQRDARHRRLGRDTTARYLRRRRSSQRCAQRIDLPLVLVPHLLQDGTPRWSARWMAHHVPMRGTTICPVIAMVMDWSSDPARRSPASAMKVSHPRRSRSAAFSRARSAATATESANRCSSRTSSWPKSSARADAATRAPMTRPSTSSGTTASERSSAPSRIGMSSPERSGRPQVPPERPGRAPGDPAASRMPSRPRAVRSARRPRARRRSRGSAAGTSRPPRPGRAPARPRARGTPRPPAGPARPLGARTSPAPPAPPARPRREGTGARCSTARCATGSQQDGRAPLVDRAGRRRERLDASRRCTTPCSCAATLRSPGSPGRPRRVVVVGRSSTSARGRPTTPGADQPSRRWRPWFHRASPRSGLDDRHARSPAGARARRRGGVVPGFRCATAHTRLIVG